MEEQEQMDLQILTQIDENIQKVNELKNDERFKEALNLLNKTKPLSEKIFDVDTRKEKAISIEEIIKEIKQIKNKNL